MIGLRRMASDVVAFTRELVLLLFQRIVELPRNVKQAVLLVLDLLAVPLSLYAALWLRLGLADMPKAGPILLVCLLTLPISAIVFLRLGLYRAIVRFMGYEALIAIIKGVTYSALVLSLMILLTQTWMPRSVPFLYWCLLLACVGGSRLFLRTWFKRSRIDKTRRVAIYGAGSAGRQLLSALHMGKEYEPVLFIDDDPRLQGRVIHGVPVLAMADLPEALVRLQIGEVFLAMASLGGARRRAITSALNELSVQVRSIPRLEDLVAGRARIGEVHEITLEDLLGREPVPPRPDLLAVCIRDHSVMVTGAGGSIGSELCRQILNSEPKRLLLLENNELALYNIESELRARCERAGTACHIVGRLGSVQDHAQMRALMIEHDIQTVYHAAAYKHVPIVESNVIEGVRNNAFGTWSMTRAAAECGVETFVLVSSDKAVRPSSVMGASKRVAEMLMQAMAAETTLTRYVIVRFGNVIGSSGSVVPLFQQQIASGGPVTVTHPEAQRYFMTIPEAAQLVLQASAMGSGGDVFVLDMGAAVRILDVARRMIRLAGKRVRDEQCPDGDIEISIIGLRPGEKLFEELLSGNNVSATGHPMIMRAIEDYPVWSTLEPALRLLQAACDATDVDQALAVLQRLVPAYRAAVNLVAADAIPGAGDETPAAPRSARLYPIATARRADH